MRAIIILGLLIAFAFFAGWLTMRGDRDKASIEINATEFRNDAEHVIDEGKALINKGTDKLEGAH